jgi:mannose-6-phosphate isomerase-like protein (cupin superfamily)
MPAIIIGPDDGRRGPLGAIGVRLMASGEQTGGGFSLVEHPMPPRSLAAPLHRHTHEDEYSYVLEGTMGADLGGEVVLARAGDLVFKPRGQWHSFWNPGDEPARILEIISPAGFERYFEALLDLGPGADRATMGPLMDRFGLEVDPASIPVLCERHGLRIGGR